MGTFLRYILLGVLIYVVWRMIFPAAKVTKNKPKAQISTDLQYCDKCKAYVSLPHTCDSKQD